ncbi:MAG: SUMF1/EgtB/PvdO family nonheme iron enzyme [Proteobacteria bacterium]|nr:SUMF1/EgtB/PvdO family nonheme iron enzyme [Pseudomonadota bacterium]
MKKILFIALATLFFVSCSGRTNSGHSGDSSNLNTENNSTESSDKDITSFSINGSIGIITGTDISVTMPYGTNEASLIPTITVSEGAEVSPKSGVAQNFTSSQTYTVTAEDGTTKDYTVTVAVASSSSKDITSFIIQGKNGVINGTNITVTLPYGTSVTSLTPTIGYTGVSVSPASGMAQNFTNPQSYTVTAADGTTKGYTVTVVVSSMPAGYKTAFTANGITFNMVYVPGGLTFPTGTNDSGSASVANAYWIGETDVTYELWYDVISWAEAKRHYSFANAGREGKDGTIGAPPTTAKNEPVTTINWRDAMIFSNALTEWYNAKNGTSYTCVYYTDAAYTTPIKTSTNSTTVTTAQGTQDNPYVKANATGFRMLGSYEWELAARYIGTTPPTVSPLSTEKKTTIVGGVTYYWTPGDYASGATADVNNSAATKAVSWHSDNSGYNTHDVKGLRANALGLYDMNGNIWLWIFDWHPSYIGSARFIRGGSFGSTAYCMQISYIGYHYPYTTEDAVGFRFARTQ